MNGHELAELPIAVDRFSHSPRVQLYFLTHTHADHTVGLTNYWKRKIYCTELSGRMLNFRLKVEKRYLIPLEELQPHVFKLRTLKGWVYLTVTVIPVNHCPGACMFLFETDNIRILYTGDFRPDTKLYEVGENLWGPTHRKIDVMYLDNTYAEPACVFPPKEKAIEEIVKLCKFHQDCTIFIGITWTGHEEILKAIGLETEQYIVVTPKHLELLKLIGVENVFDSDENSSNIQVLPSHLVNFKRLRKIDESESCVGIVPTAKFCHLRSGVISNDLLYTVPYSNHSSYTELWEFVKSVRPGKFKPIVPGRTNNHGMESHFRADMSQFHCLLNEEPLLSLPSLNFSLYCNAERDCDLDSQEFDNTRKRKQNTKFNVRKKKNRSTKPCGVVFDGDRS